MKIKKITIKNFRSIVECDFEFKDLLALVGENNSGKSNIIDAIEMVLSKNKVNNEFDFYDKSKPIEIEIIFHKLTNFEKNKISSFLNNNLFVLKKEFFYKEKENGDPDSESKMYYIKDKKKKPTKASNFFSGETLPEFYKVPAVKELREETKIATTSYFGKFLELLFGSDDYDFSNLDDLLRKVNTELKREDKDAPLVKGAKEIEEVMCEQFRDCCLSFEIDISRRKDLISQVDIFADDGCKTPLFTKGHGTQRAFIFSILLLYAKKLNSKLVEKNARDKKDIIIAIEEPEIYLHPHQQRIIYNLFKKLVSSQAEQIQIIYSTHSSFMINIEDYKYLGLVTKNSIKDGTKVTQCIEDIFKGNDKDKEEFKMMCQFDPERNEMFFADKIILCEGDTEKYSLPVILDKLDINPIDKRISVVECGSKNGIPLFQKVLNKFNKKENKFDYYVMYDLDIPPKKYKDENHKKELEEEARKINKDIDDLMGNIKQRFIFDPDFERYLSLEIGEEDKPYKARKKLLQKNKKCLPVDLVKFITDNFKN